MRLAGIQLLRRGARRLLDEPAGGSAHARLHAGLEFLLAVDIECDRNAEGLRFREQDFQLCRGITGGIEPDEAELGAATECLRGMAIEVVAQRQVGILERLRELGGVIAHKGRAVQFEGDVGRCDPVEETHVAGNAVEIDEDAAIALRPAVVQCVEGVHDGGRGFPGGCMQAQAGGDDLALTIDQGLAGHEEAHAGSWCLSFAKSNESAKNSFSGSLHLSTKSRFAAAIIAGDPQA